MAGDEGRRLMTPCRCASIPFQFEPHRERVADATIVTHYRATTGATEGERAASIYSRLARHEAGHCVAAIAFRKKLHHLTIGAGQPHLCYDLLSGETTVDALALINVAGLVAEGSPAPTWGDMHESLQRAREKITGICDMCKLFDLVVSACPERDGREIINTVYDTFEAASDLFQSPQWSGALDALAPALERETLLSGDDIAAIVSPFDLRAPLENLPAIWTTHP
jgi:hypothetical protein